MPTYTQGMHIPGFDPPAPGQQPQVATPPPAPIGVPAAAPAPPVPAGPSELEAAYKRFLAAKGSTDGNSLTNQVVRTVLEQAVKEQASDVHFDPTEQTYQIRFRVDGSLKERLTYNKSDFQISAQLRVMAGFPPQAATAYSPEDGGFELAVAGRQIRFRASAFPSIHGDKLVLRVLDMGANTLNLDALGFAPDVLASLKAAIQAPSGIFFVCGITGGGKTTTLCSILKTLVRPEINAMTLEDPVEYEIPHVVQSKINPKAGFNFADGLRSILRQDPNIIMVGEVRDLETAEIAMRAALTGHLIFSTIHTISAIGVISRLIDMGIEPFLISNALIGTLAQRLVRKVCPHCAQPAPIDQASVESVLKPLDTDSANLVRAAINAPGGRYVRPKGCAECGMVGFRGRVGIFELLLLDKEMRAKISGKSTPDELRRAALESGMKSLLLDGVEKARAGITTFAEVAKAAKEM